MIGTYRIYQDGVLLQEAHNLITSTGQRAILKFLAGYVQNFAGAITVGASSNPVGLTDTKMGFELGRSPVDVGSVDFTNSAIIFKGTLADNIEGTITEIGLWALPSPQYLSNNILAGFIDSEPWSTGTFVAANARVFTQALRLTPTANGQSTTTNQNISVNLSDYPATSPFSFAFTGDANTSSIVVRLMTDSSNYYSYTVSSPGAGYKTVTFTKNDMITTGSPSWGSINQISVVVSAKSAGATSVDLDGIRMEESDYSNPDQALVSHALLVTPQVKPGNAPLDVEYVLSVPIT